MASTDAKSDTGLSALFAPSAIAVVGASEREGNSAGYVMKNLARFGYAGRVMPVHPKAETVFGLPAAPSLSALDTAPDCVVIGLRAGLVPETLEEAGRLGARAAVILASGFGETGAEGAALEAQVAEIARRHGMAVCGPNCLGLVACDSGAALYSSTISPELPRGRTALISASGASAIALAHSGQIGLAALVSAGNSAVTGLADYVTHFAADPGVDTIALVIEDMGAPDALAAAMERVHAAGKTAVALRVGRSAAGQRATAAHTGALAGTEDAARAFCDRVGLLDMPDMDSFLAALRLAQAFPTPPAHPRAAILGVSGGGVAHVADIAADCSLPLAELSAASVAALRDLLPGFATPQNPLDVTGAPFGDPSLYGKVLRILDADPGVGLVLAAQDAPPALAPDMAAEYTGIAAAVAEYDAATPVIALANLSVGLQGQVATAYGSALRLQGTRAALTATRAWATTPRHVSWRAPRGTAALPARLSEPEARALMAPLGLPGPSETMVTSAEAARAAVAALPGLAVLKIASPDIGHKTEAGGVALSVTADAAAETFERIMASARAHAPEAGLDGVLVQEMVGDGVDAMLGLIDSPPFGPGIVVGLGGTMVELLDDAAFDLLPLDEARAEALLRRTRLDALLSGYRGGPACDRAALIAAMVALSDWGSAHAGAIEAVDLNPVRVLPLSQGGGLRLLDALILTKTGAPG